MDLYEKIPAGRMNGIKGIGFCLEDGSIYDGTYDLMVAGEVQKEFINEIPHYRESSLVQKAIADMEAILSERAGQYKSEPDKESATLSIPQTNEEKDVYVQESNKTGTEIHESDGEDVRAESKAPEPEKTAQTVLKTDRDISGGSRKQSVLNALRERQARMKAQENQRQKPQAHRKGEQEL